MTDTDKPKKCDRKIQSIEDFYDLRLEGWHETQGKDGFWKMSKAGYFPIRIPQGVVKANPSEFAEKIDPLPGLLEKIYEQDEQRKANVETPQPENEEPERNPNIGLVNISASATTKEPLISLSTQDMLVHDPARILLQSIVLTEKLYLLPEHQRHEHAFAGIFLDEKGKATLDDKYTKTKEITFSLADLAIYRLVEHYVSALHAKEIISALEKERDELRQEVEVRNIELGEVQYNYDNLTQAMAIKIISTR